MDFKYLSQPHNERSSTAIYIMYTISIVFAIIVQIRCQLIRPIPNTLQNIYLHRICLVRALLINLIHPQISQMRLAAIAQCLMCNNCVDKSKWHAFNRVLLRNPRAASGRVPRVFVRKKTVRKTLANAQAISIWVQRAVSVLDLRR